MGVIRKMFANVFARETRFGKPQPGALTALEAEGPELTVPGYNNDGYQFNTVGPIRHPGPAYISPLQQFQSWEKSMVQGAGTLVLQPFRAFEPQTANQSLEPVVSGTSGILTGVVASQPLIDTSSNIGTVG